MQDDSASNHPARLVSIPTGPAMSADFITNGFSNIDMPKKLSTATKTFDTTSPYPAMPTRKFNGEAPFLIRISTLIDEWIQKEWLAIEQVRKESVRLRWSKKFTDSALAEVRLTPDNLAHSLDNISLGTLRRELKKLGAPPPGELIRQARIAFAKHLMTHTRILGSEVASKAGFSHYRYFAAVFTEVTGMSPNNYRQAHVRDHAHPKRD